MGEASVARSEAFNSSFQLCLVVHVLPGCHHSPCIACAHNDEVESLWRLRSRAGGRIVLFTTDASPYPTQTSLPFKGHKNEQSFTCPMDASLPLCAL